MPTEFVLYYEKEEDLFKNKTKEEKEKILPEMVQYALSYGNKPAARKYYMSPANVRNWVRKYQILGLDGLKIK